MVNLFLVLFINSSSISRFTISKVRISGSNGLQIKVNLFYHFFYYEIRICRYVICARLKGVLLSQAEIIPRKPGQVNAAKGMRKSRLEFPNVFISDTIIVIGEKTKKIKF